MKEGEDAFPDKWLTTCDANFIDAKLRKDAAYTQHFFPAKQLISVQPVIACFRHAVKATQVTPVGNCQAQVIDFSSVFIYQHFAKVTNVMSYVRLFRVGGQKMELLYGCLISQLFFSAERHYFRA